jgi:hypothetical protein
MMRAAMAAAASTFCPSSRLAALLPPAPAPLLLRAARPLCGDVRRYGVGSHVSDNDPEVLEAEKRRNLSQQHEGSPLPPGAVPNAPGWNPKLASDSEAVVKAERAGEMGIEEMVDETVRELKGEQEQKGGGEGGKGGAAGDAADHDK